MKAASLIQNITKLCTVAVFSQSLLNLLNMFCSLK